MDESGFRELLDNLSRKLAELAGEGPRDDVFAGLEVPTIGAGPAEKRAFMRQLVERLSSRIDDDTLRTVLNGGLHFVPREAFAEERERYVAAPSIGWFIADEHRRYVEYLARLEDEGALYHVQPITDDVVAYVRDTPTCGGSVRRGDEIHTTEDPVSGGFVPARDGRGAEAVSLLPLPVGRESILHSEAGVSPRFCQCSAGFEKQYWDAVLGQPVEVDVVRSVLQGVLVCEFAVHLPEDVVRSP